MHDIDSLFSSWSSEATLADHFSPVCTLQVANLYLLYYLIGVANLVCVLFEGGAEMHMFEMICEDNTEILS